MSSSDNINTTRLHVLAAVASQEERLPAYERLHYDCLLILAEAANRVLAGLSSEEESEKEEEEVDRGTREESPPGVRTTESDYDGGSSGGGGSSMSEAEDTIIAWAKTSTSVSSRDRRRSPPNLRRENKNMPTRCRRRRLEQQQQRRGRQARGGGDGCPRRDDDHRVADAASRALCQVVRRDGLGGACLRYQPRQAETAFSAVGDRTGLILTMTDVGDVRIEFTHARTEDK
ncbi:hypothetical protein L209DRAFT_728093 [Thermothelomyces heterothallicus CBS 203.75]